MNKFAAIVEDIQTLSVDEIEDLNHITKNRAIQARRNEILSSAIHLKRSFYTENQKDILHLIVYLKLLKENDRNKI